jgi:hypothetical protein
MTVKAGQIWRRRKGEMVLDIISSDGAQYWFVFSRNANRYYRISEAVLVRDYDLMGESK